jgi:hypothetical protein
MITAEEARKITKDNKYEQAIRAAAEKGYNAVDIKVSDLTDEQTDELMKRFDKLGYKLWPRYREGLMYLGLTEIQIGW